MIKMAWLTPTPVAMSDPIWYGIWTYRDAITAAIGAPWTNPSAPPNAENKKGSHTPLNWRIST